MIEAAMALNPINGQPLTATIGNGKIGTMTISTRAEGRFIASVLNSFRICTPYQQVDHGQHGVFLQFFCWQVIRQPLRV